MTPGKDPRGKAATRPRICVVDDDETVRDAMVDLFESRAMRISPYDSAERFLSIWKTSELREVPAAIILDIRMPGMSGLEAFRTMTGFGLPKHNVVMFLSAHGELPTAVQLLKEGAFDFFEKPFADNAFVDRVAQALAQAESAHAQQADAARHRALLSSRESEVAELILEGLVNREIAEKLAISTRTVEIHRAKIFEKLQVRNTVEFVRTVVERQAFDRWNARSC